MRIIVLASQKGGSGKTTLSGHLAVEAERAGVAPAALIDTDPQGSLSHWWNARTAGSPYFARVELSQLDDALARLRDSGVQLAVIDTPPAITASISHVVAYADLVLVPTRPSPHDLRAVGATVDIAERHRKPLIFVINAATARARITGESAVALSQHGTVAPVIIHHRVDFAASMVDGRTVGEVLPNSASAQEVRDLWAYCQDRLARLTQDATLAAGIKREAFSTTPLSPWQGESEPADSRDLALVDAEAVPAPALRIPLPAAPVQAASPPAPARMELHNLFELPAGKELHPAPEKHPEETGDRRSGTDRRVDRHATHFGGERRAGTFGRRSSDRLGKTGKWGTIGDS
jgi:chromosome partitioning protein